MDYVLKKDVVINGMPFKSGKVVNIPNWMVNDFEKEIVKTTEKEIVKKVDERNNRKEKKVKKDEVNSY